MKPPFRRSGTGNWLATFETGDEFFLLDKATELANTKLTQ
jgi:hypothetical protein